MKNWKHKQNSFFWCASMDSEKADLVSICCLVWNYLYKKRREFNLGTHLTFLDYVKAFDKVKRDKLFEILQSKNVPKLLLKIIIDIYCGNKII
jgi:hypothetical protein